MRGVQRLVVAGRERVRHEDRRLAGGCDLPDGRPGPRQHEVDRRERGAEALRLGEHAVVGARDTAPDVVVVARPVRCRIAGPASPHVSTTNSFSACAPASAPKTPRMRPSAVELEDLARLASRAIGRERAGIGRPTTAYFAPVASVDRIGEEHPLRERRCEPVREPEVRVGLATARPGCRSDRAAKTIGPAT